MIGLVIVGEGIGTLPYCTGQEPIHHFDHAHLLQGPKQTVSSVGVQ